MGNLTIAIDDDVLRRARVRAAENGTSVNAVLRRELEHYAGGTPNLIERFVELENLVPDQGSRKGRDWKREDLYRDRIEKIG